MSACSEPKQASLLDDFPRRKVHSENLITHLLTRTTTIMDPVQWYNHQRNIYTKIVPNHSENKVKTHAGCYLRKFCPDGQHLLAFSQDQRYVEIFKFSGSCGANHLYRTTQYDAIRSDVLFETFFEHQVSIMVSRGNEVLNRECSLFLADSRSFVVASSSPLPDEPYPHMFDTFRSNESLSPSSRFLLENYTIYLVSLDKTRGYVTDSRHFKCDKIFLSHNQGLSLCGTKLAVLSVQHQLIHLFEVVSGTFIPLQEIGRFCYPDDNLVFDANIYRNSPRGNNSLIQNDEYQPFLEKWINSLKHRFLCYIKEHSEKFSNSSGVSPLMQFYRRFDYFNSLRISKMQLLDQHTLLLKYTTEDIVTLRVTDPIAQPAFFAFYDIDTTLIFGVFENTSADFLEIYEKYSEHFRTAVSNPLAQDVSSVSNCLHCYALHMKFKRTITKARHGGITEATKRLLVQVPVCSQSFSPSPYLDLNLFRYDDKWVSPLERPKPYGEAPIRFFSRKSSRFNFSLHLTHLGTAPSTLPKKLVAYIVHPFEPFLISIQKMESDYIVNLHFRKN